MKTVKKALVFLMTTIAIVVFATVLVHAIFYSPSSDLTVAAADARIANGDYPVSLSIPALKINTTVQQVGLTASGAMAVPDNFTDVGWYKYGTIPGQRGSAVIDGHVDDGLAFPGVFVNLDDLKPGDDIYVTMHSGTVLDFVMTGSHAYDKDDTDTNAIFNDDSGKILHVITCTGTWLPSEATHSERLVVTAVLK